MSAIESYEGGAADSMAIRRAHLYVGNLSPRVTEYMLTEIFAVAGPVQNVKIIPDRNYQHGGLNYGFVEYLDMRSAETALQTLNGRKIFDTEIRVNWAYQGSQNKEDTSNHYHVFVGDLSPEVNDQVLQKAFSAFPSLSDARVMWDMGSGKSRGYGFLSFRDKTDAEQAIATMNGEWLGSRAIRVNWANQKTQGSGGGPGYGGPGMGSPMGGMRMPGMPGMPGMPSPVAASPMGYGAPAPAPMNYSTGPMSYETVLQQSSPYNSTVYVGNLVPYCTQADLIPLFQSIGYVSEIRMQTDRGFAFVKLDTHENAAMAIVQLQGQLVHGRPIKCSWGKDRAAEGVAQPGTPQSANPVGYSAMPMYGMPAGNAFGAYGYPGYGDGSAAGAGVIGQGAGMETSPVAGAGAAANPWGGADQTAAAQQAYYQQYWNYYGQAAGGPTDQAHQGTA